MEHLVFVAYLILFAWLVTKTKFFLNSGLTHGQLVIVFLLKVMAGIIYGWIGVYYGKLAQMMDTWIFHYGGIEECKILLRSPVEFFKPFFTYHHEGGFSRFLTSKDSWWNDIKYISFIKLLGVFNLFSFGNYYVNIIFYSFITMFGPVAIYRVMKEAFRIDSRLLFLSTFLIPSFLYWTSGLHKEGLVFMGVALIVYEVYGWLAGNKLQISDWLVLILSFATIFLLRGFLIGLFIPILLIWIITAKIKKRPLITTMAAYTILLFVFFSAKFIHPKLDFPGAVAKRQQEFQATGGASAIEIQPLEPTIGGFIVNLPQAIDLSIVRPYLSDAKHLLLLTAAIETAGLLCLFFLFLMFKKKSEGQIHFKLFCYAFALFLFLMAGYTVNNIGAIVRYRSIALPFIIIPVVLQTDWSRIKNTFNKKHTYFL